MAKKKQPADDESEAISFETVVELKALKPGAKPYEARDRKTVGGYATVRPSGILSYVLRYALAGKNRKLTYGALDLDDGSLKRARAWARVERNAIEAAQAGRGADPAAAKKAQREAAERAAEAARIVELEARANTFEAVSAEYLASRDVVKLRHVTRRERVRQITKVLAPWRDKPITEIRRRDVFKLLDPIAATKPVMANRIYATLTHFFSWCEQREFITANPMKGVPRPLEKEPPRERVLDDAELAIVWRAASTLGFPYGPFFQMAILTGGRRSECARMTWAEVRLDAATWSLESTRTKNAKPLERPLAPMAVALLRSLPRCEGIPFIFGSALVTQAIAKQRLDRAILEVNGGQSLPGGSFVLHDLRRTFATGLQRLGVQLEVTERLLGHVGESQSGIRKVYQKHTFAAEKAEAVRLWAEHVEKITGEPTPAPSNVVPISARRS